MLYEKRLNEKCQVSFAVKYINNVRVRLRSEARNAKRMQKLVCHFKSYFLLLSQRRLVLIKTYDRDLEKVAENLQFIVNKFESEIRVTEHSEEETKASVSLFLPLIKLTFLSNEIAVCLQKRAGTSEEEIWNVLTGEIWNTTNLQTDSSQLKRACILYILGYHQDPLYTLKSIPGGVRFSFCTCNRENMWKKAPGDVEDTFVRRLDMLDDNVTTKDFIWNLASLCVPFSSTEASVTPSVIKYPMFSSKTKYTYIYQ